MKEFLIKILRFCLIGFIPASIIVTTYFILDPFKVLYDYEDFTSYVDLNRDYVSTELLIKNHKKYGYNSFVFGSSRTMGYKADTWLSYLPDTSHPFMFDARSESMYGVYIKLKYLDENNIPIDHVLICVDRDNSFLDPNIYIDHLCQKHPVTSGQSKLKFHFNFLKTYLNPKFLFCYYYYTITKNYKPFMAGYIQDISSIEESDTDPSYNTANTKGIEKKINRDVEKYYTERKHIFYERTGESMDAVERINEEYDFYLKEIATILKKNNTNYKVVLNPLYDQIKIHPNDYAKLKRYFGDNLYDFTGKNILTDSITNYYETSHFRPNVGDSIFKWIYK